MLYSSAKTYIARALGNSSYTDEADAAGDALKAAIQEWNIVHDWRFLLMDTRNGFTVASCSSDGAATSAISTSTSNGFAGVNVGQTATGFTNSITVGTISSTTAFVATGDSGAVQSGITLTFSADIPVVAGTSVYNLPSPFKRPYSARMLSNERTLVWKDRLAIDRQYTNQSPQQSPVFYTCYNPDTFVASTRQNGRVELFPVPSEADTLRIRFYRPIAEPSVDGDYLDVLDRQVYALLERAKFYYMKNKDSENVRTQYTDALSMRLLMKAIKDDRSASVDRDMVMTPQIEWGWTRFNNNSDIIITDW